MPAPDTRPSLLLRLRDPGNRQAWEEFVGLYQPIVLRMALRRGMQEADAEDLTQQVLIQLVGAIDGFEPDRNRGRFLTWLKTIAHRAIINAMTRTKADRSAGGTDAWLQLEQIALPESDVAEIEREYRREIFVCAAAQVRQEVGTDTWVGFWETVVMNRPVDEVAKEIGRTRGNIYTSRSRVLKRLKEKVEQLDQTSLDDIPSNGKEGAT